MKIKSIKIKNVKSFKNEVELDFSQDFNILVGPNGSGKSNLLDILTVCIRKFFLRGYIVRDNTDATGLFKVIDYNNSFDNIQKHLEKFYEDSSNSEIEFKFLIKEEDIKNLDNIRNNVDLYEQRLQKYRNHQNYSHYMDAIRKWDLSKVEQSEELTYKIGNNSLPTPNVYQEKIFLDYLNMLELLLILAKEPPDIDIYPSYLYFSPYRGADLQNLQANLSAQNFYEILQYSMGATSKTLSSLINLATLYFSMKRRDFENEATSQGYNEKWEADEEVKLVTKYLKKMGYAWQLQLIDRNKNIYEILLTKENKKFYLSQASSGEQEIINFLLGIFAFHIKNGLIIVDEPELHLHPKWQKELLELFIELSKTTKNQFIISTHSPTFINERSYNHVIRIYKGENNVSDKVILKDTDQLKLKDILHIVNTTNNEKIFFADIVILVEGLTDLLVFQKIVREFVEVSNISKIVEVVAIQGKNNQEKFRHFLNNLKIPSCFITDLDFVNECGTAEIKELFKTNETKVVRDVFKNPKSKDGDNLVEYLDYAISNNAITDDLKSLVEYIKSFRRKLKPNLKEEEQSFLSDFISQQKKYDVYILEKGDIEDYFPEGFRGKDIDKVISLLSDNTYIDWQQNEGSCFVCLSNIIKEILQKYTPTEETVSASTLEVIEKNEVE